MTEWNPQVVIIESIQNHPNADALDIATVIGDYPVIIKRGEYQVGDIAGYIPIDSIVPDTDQFYFLCPKTYEKYEDENGIIQHRHCGQKYPLGSVPEKYRIIKAKDIRGVYSQGMLVRTPIILGLNPGTDITDIFSLKKYEEHEEENIPGIKLIRGNQESPPNDFNIPYYDLSPLRKYLNCLHEGEEIILTEKLHGSNFSSCHNGNRLYVKSRNFFKKKDTKDSWWDIAIRLNLEEKLIKYPYYVFFGELYGMVKGFHYDCKIENGVLQSKVRFFDIYDSKNSRYLDYDDKISILNILNLDHVPELYRGKWTGKNLYSFAEGQSTLNNKHLREGFVLSTVKERYEPKLHSRMKVKLIGQGYNLKK